MVRSKRRAGQSDLIWGGQFSGKNKEAVIRAYNRLSKGKKSKIKAYIVVTKKRATKTSDGIYKIWGKRVKKKRRKK
jgi:hypothetical protein